MNKDNYISNKLTIAYMLKKFLLFVAVSVLTILLCVINAGAETYGNYEYRVLEDGTVEITDYTAKSLFDHIEIPAKIDGKRVTSIGENSINDGFVRSVIIPDGVTKICDSAFETSGISSVVIPGSVTYIGEQAFAFCLHLKSVNVPASVDYIGYEAFNGCNNLALINVDNNNQRYTSVDGVLFNKDKTKLIQYPSGNERTKYVIPDSVTTIGASSFRYSVPTTNMSLTSIDIPESVTIIEEYAFYGCDSLISVTLPSKVKSIERYAFDSCESLQSITFPYGVSNIHSSAMGSKYTNSKSLVVYCPKNSKAEKVAVNSWIPYVNYNVKITPDGKFEYTEHSDGTLEISGYLSDDPVVIIPSVIDGKKVTKIGMNAFKDCDYIESVTIPKSVVRIDDYSFSGCTSLRRVIIENAGDNTNGLKPLNVLGNVGNKLVDNDNETSESYSSGLVSIGEGAFFGCSALTEITLPDSVTEIDAKAFRDCTSLESVSFSENLTSIGDGAFFGCSSLKSAEIPESVTEIGSSAFEGCTSLESVNIPDGISEIKENTFKDCTSLTSVSFSENLTSIGDGAFFGCSSLKSAEIPESVTDIGDKAFGYYDDNGDYVTDETTIVAPKDSVAHQYAIDNNFNYAELNKNISTLITLVIVLIVVLVIIAIGITILIVLVKKKNKVTNPASP